MKILLKGSAEATISALSGLKIVRWHDVELPKAEQPRVDLLGEDEAGQLLHIELQSTNDPKIALRMASYGTDVARAYGEHPKQVLLYVGNSTLKMPGEYHPNENVLVRYRVIDMRSLDGESLLSCQGIGDNILAILASLKDQPEAIREILKRIVGLDTGAQRAALTQLSILADLRHLGPVVTEEVNRMPLTNSILDHEVLGPVYKKGLQEGRQEGRQEGELTVLRILITKRFGSVPDWVEQRLAERSPSQLELLFGRILDAQTLEDLFR